MNKSQNTVVQGTLINLQTKNQGYNAPQQKFYIGSKPFDVQDYQPVKVKKVDTLQLNGFQEPIVSGWRLDNLYKTPKPTVYDKYAQAMTVEQSRAAYERARFERISESLDFIDNYNKPQYVPAADIPIFSPMSDVIYEQPRGFASKRNMTPSDTNSSPNSTKMEEIVYEIPRRMRSKSVPNEAFKKAKMDFKRSYEDLRFFNQPIFEKSKSVEILSPSPEFQKKPRNDDSGIETSSITSNLRKITRDFKDQPINYTLPDKSEKKRYNRFID